MKKLTLIVLALSTLGILMAGCTPADPFGKRNIANNGVFRFVGLVFELEVIRVLRRGERQTRQRFSLNAPDQSQPQDPDDDYTPKTRPALTMLETNHLAHSLHFLDFT